MYDNLFRILNDDNQPLTTDEVVYHNIPIIDREPPNISACILGAINWDKFSENMDDNFEKMQRLCTLEIESLNNIIDLQEYNIPSTRIATVNGRYLGVGINGFATFVAKLGLDYNNPKLWQITHDMAEMQMYCLMYASNQLARQVGECKWFYKTKYALGIMPPDNYKKSVDDIVSNALKMDWEGLRKSIKQYGLRNSAFFACMPVQSSSVISNSTNGMELPRSPLTIIKSKNRLLRQIIKDFAILEDNYSYCWDVPTNKGYINICAVIQKFADQGISANTYYDSSWFESDNIPISELVGDILYAYRMGLKTMYYHNSNDRRDEMETDKDEQCELTNKENCESCNL